MGYGSGDGLQRNFGKVYWKGLMANGITFIRG